MRVVIHTSLTRVGGKDEQKDNKQTKKLGNKQRSLLKRKKNRVRKRKKRTYLIYTYLYIFCYDRHTEKINDKKQKKNAMKLGKKEKKSRCAVLFVCSTPQTRSSLWKQTNFGV